MPPSATLSRLLQAHAERASLWRPFAYAKGQPIDCRKGSVAHLVIVPRGLVKLSYVTPDGDARIKSFITAPGLFDMDPASIEPAIEATCLEATQAAILPLSWAREIAAGDPTVRTAVDAFWLWLSARKRRRESALLCSTPVQRFASFQREEPTLVARLPQGDVARYLGITPIAFSRLKRRQRSAAQQPPKPAPPTPPARTA